MNQNPKASIIVPSYNREDIIYATLLELSNIAAKENTELILVDQTGYDRIKIEKITRSCLFKYIRLNKPNLPKARNAGIKAASGEIFLFIDDDAQPQAGWIQNHLSAYKDSTIGCTAGSVIDMNSKGSSKEPVFYDSKTGEYTADFGCKIPQETITFPGGNCSIRRIICDQLRFDPIFKRNAYFEEVDFAFRLRRTGWKIYYEPSASIVHNKAPSGGCRCNSFSEVYFRFRNYALFYFRHSKFWYCVKFFKREKKYVEYISRKKTGGHKTSVVFVAGIGVFIGSIIGLYKRIWDFLFLH